MLYDISSIFFILTSNLKLLPLFNFLPIYICPLELPEDLRDRNLSPLKQEMGDMEGLLCLGWPHRVLLGFSSPFSLIFLNPEGNLGGTRKGIVFGQRLTINSAGKVSFKGTWFQAVSVTP